MESKNLEISFIVSIVVLIVMFGGDPDIADAIAYYLMNN